MKKLIFILLFCIFSNYSFAQYIPSNGAGSSTSGVIFSGTPFVGYVPIATSPTTAVWSNTFTNGLGLAQAVSPNAAISQGALGLYLNETAGGSCSAQCAYNLLSVTADTVAVAAGSVGTPLEILNIFGGTGMTGNRVGINVNSNLTATSSNSGLQSYGAIAGQVTANVNDGGTGTSFTLAKSQLQGFNFIGSLLTGATDYFQVAGGEINVRVQTGASAHQKIGLIVAKLADDRVQGTGVDAALNIADQANASVPAWTNGILFGQPSSETGAQWPFSSSSTAIGVANPGALGTAIDFTGATISNFLLKSTNYTIDGSGNTVTAGKLTINGGGSGSTISSGASSSVTALTVSDTVGAAGFVRQSILNNSNANSSSAQILVGTGVGNAFAVFSLTNGAGAPQGQFTWGSGVTSGLAFINNATTTATLNNGLQVGAAPTGGDKGAGSINFSGTLWSNGTQGVSTTCTETVGNTLVFTNGILTTKGANCT